MSFPFKVLLPNGIAGEGAGMALTAGVGANIDRIFIKQPPLLLYEAALRFSYPPLVSLLERNQVTAAAAAAHHPMEMCACRTHYRCHRFIVSPQICAGLLYNKIAISWNGGVLAFEMHAWF